MKPVQVNLWRNDSSFFFAGGKWDWSLTQCWYAVLYSSIWVTVWERLAAFGSLSAPLLKPHTSVGLIFISGQSETPVQRLSVSLNLGLYLTCLLFTRSGPRRTLNKHTSQPRRFVKEELVLYSSTLIKNQLLLLSQQTCWAGLCVY